MGNSHWNVPNSNATDSHNFIGLPAGARNHLGDFYNIGNTAYWRTASEISSINSAGRTCFHNSGVFNWDRLFNKKGGFSVRCIQNPESLLWSTGQTTPSITVSPTQTTTYYVTISNGISSCVDSMSVNVNNINPNLFYEDTIRACGTSYTLDAGNGYSSYSWNTGATSQSIAVTNSGWYKCTVTQNSCSFADSIFLSLANAQIANNDTAICSGSPVTLRILNPSAAIDIDGNNYQTIQIGSQIWTQKNLNVSRYRNGDIIPQVTDPNQWKNLTTGAWCWYNNDSSLGSVYGKLYNWYALADPRGLAPAGWHVPSDAEWNTLSKFLDSNADTSCVECIQSSIVGGLLKDSSPYWNFPNIYINNNINFNALPAGRRSSDGLPFHFIGSWACWWSGTLRINGGSFCRLVGNSSSKFEKFSDGRETGYGIRLIEDISNTSNSNGAIWNTGANTSKITVSPVQTTTYYVTVSNGISSCNDSVTIIVNDLNTNLFAQDTIRACGASYTLDIGSGYSSYSWNTATTTQSISVTETGWYKCTVTQNGCSAQDSVFVSLVNSQISNRDTTICQGSNLILGVYSPVVSDLDGNTYPVVNIGSQIWMQKNLSVSRYRNGDIIPQVSNPSQMTNLTSGAWCWYNNDSANYGSIYGKLYNWYATIDPRGLAPEGWKVPDEHDWNILSKNIDNTADTNCVDCIQSYSSGGKLKALVQWNSPNLGASNSSGFSALPGGRTYGSGFFDAGNFGGWWNSSYYYSNIVMIRTVEYNNPNFSKRQVYGYWGYSVRCLKMISAPVSNFSYLWSTGATTPSITVSPSQASTYYVTVSNGISSCTDSVKVTILATPDAGSINGSDTVCVGISSEYLSNGELGGEWETSNTSIAYIDSNTGSLSAISAGNTEVRYVVSSSSCGSDTARRNVAVKTCLTLVNIKAFIQGFYATVNYMRPSMFYSGINGATLSQVDTVTVEIHDGQTGEMIGVPQKAIISIDGTATVSFPAITGFHYLVVKHRNALETWSANPIAMGPNVTYDFTTAANKAFGNNMTSILGGKFALWSGDVNQDGAIESSDYSEIENDVLSILFGYHSSDITGDGIVESDDYFLIENNLLRIIFVQRPF
jgi:uncharacterized protein (TIGR02145 family)